MRNRRGLLLAGAVAVAGAGCGDEEDHANLERPAASVNVTAAIADGRVNVSPERIGAGPIRLIVSNQTRSAQSLTFETGGNDPGVTRESAPIPPSGTGTLEVDDVAEGEYEIRSSDRKLRPAAISVGAPRPSAQDQLLLP